MRIPFTNIKLTVGETSEGKQRSLTTGKATYDISSDVVGAKIDRNSLFAAYRNSSDVFSCIREISETTGVGGFGFRKIGSDTDLNQSNSQKIITYYYNTVNTFKEEVIKQALITGDCFVEKVMSEANTLIGFKIMDARSIAIIADENGRIMKYIQKSPFNSNYSDAVLFEPNEVIHFKIGINNNSEVFGFSPLEPVLWEVKADIAASVSNYTSISNNSMPAGFILFDTNASDTEIKQTIEMIKKQHKGSQNKGRLMASKNVRDIKPLQMTHVDMQYLDGRRLNTEKVCSAFGVPKAILGYTEGMTFNNQDGQMQKFYNTTVVKYESWFTSIINKELEVFNEELYFNTPVFESTEQLWKRAIEGRREGLITINEARALVDYDPIDTAKHADMGDVIITGNGAGSRAITDIGNDGDIDLAAKIKELDVQ